jgi:FlgD Ig-like domain
MSRPRTLALALAVSLAAMPVATTSHAYDPITWRSLGCGGVAFATAGGYRLGATIGQPDAGTLAAGAFTLRGGFWTGGQAPVVGVADGPPVAGPFRFFPTRPNPVRTRSSVAFDLPRASRVALSLFDVSGRVVHRWDYGVLPAGRQERAWSAVDDGGRPLSSGVYFLRLATEREQGVHRVIVLR